NLYWALWHLRHENRTRVLWIDTLCINQEDEKEKNHQIRQMGRIFERAGVVVAWLG
ncbi:HET-domain-containing protein, partial [Acephala macrosclerotiorum]